MTLVLSLPRDPAKPDAAEVAAVAITVPEPAVQRRPMSGIANRMRIEAVSKAAPLEAEWVALQDDLERAREQIERELPLRF